MSDDGRKGAARVVRWTAHYKRKRYCICREAYNSRPMVQCAGRCQEWFHNECVAPTDAEMLGSAKYVCVSCRSKGGAWLIEPTYCVCAQPDGGRFMVECDACASWFHGSCVGVSKRAAVLLDSWRCARCTTCAGAAVTAMAVASPPARADLSQPPALSTDLWAHILALLPVTKRLRLATISRALLTALDATFQSHCAVRLKLAPTRVQGVADSARRPSRHGPVEIVATLCPWLHAAQAHGCRCCLASAGEFPCKRTGLASARIASTAVAGAQPPKRFLLCRPCARRRPLVARLELLGYEVATESLSGRPLWPRHFHCPLGGAAEGDDAQA
jgi:hypothetical protein